MPDFRIIPSIDELRQRERVRDLVARYGHAPVVQALREETDALRQRLSADELASTPDSAPLPTSTTQAADLIESGIEPRLQRQFELHLRPVINATGVIVHTNLGRAPLSKSALDRVAQIGSRYSTLEYDLERGERGQRDRHAEALLCRLTGAEAAVVVNNNAAATMLVLAAMASGRDVIVSRGELVEIGGGFRVPDVMALSGAVLCEVGTTNKTRAGDYAAAISERTALILRVHRSNFRIEGFTEQPTLEELVQVGRQAGVPVAEDLGSGNLIGGMATSASLGGVSLSEVPGLERLLGGEPTVQGSVEAGVDLLCFSGDKILGGPQAGIIIGRRSLMTTIRRHPLMRALRVDKMTYAALGATLQEYLSGRATRTIPVLRMLTRTPADIEARARVLASALDSSGLFRTAILDGRSTIGGGTTPGLTLPTRLLALQHRHLSADALGAALRRLDLPVIARIADDRVLLDLRTVFEDEDDTVSRLLMEIQVDQPTPIA
jgi:L-seryl-tRNA(Ser) seleniumtransferase